MRTARRRREFRRRRGGRRLLDPLLLAVFAASLTVAVIPMLEVMKSNAQARSVVAGLSSTVDETYDAGRMDCLSQAQRYNMALSGGADEGVLAMGGNHAGPSDILPLASRTEGQPLLPYEEQLRWRNGVALCWIEIPSLGLREPVYHGTSDEALAMGVGHVEWSSLPVGGPSSHCVLAAHSGMQHALMFDQLGALEAGDTFVVHTLGDAYQYSVYATQTVLPEEAQASCQIEPGSDLCTLMTCTPYGINSHRLLVHGRRVRYTPEGGQAESMRLAAAMGPRALPLMLLLAGSCLPICARALGRVRERAGRRRVSHMTWRNI